jgi:hypothetical protein
MTRVWAKIGEILDFEKIVHSISSRKKIKANGLHKNYVFGYSKNHSWIKDGEVQWHEKVDSSSLDPN